jgi:hypothetical protein
VRDLKTGQFFQHTTDNELKGEKRQQQKKIKNKPVHAKINRKLSFFLPVYR